jgi:L-ascorbate metabolism protein UlaG (beta-lactamase superfamily)
MPFNVTLVGGPTAVLEIAGLRIITDPTFDPPQTYTDDGTEGTNGITKTAGPALAANEVGPVDVALISHDHHIDNLDRSGREFLTHIRSIFTTAAGAKRLGNGAIGLDDYESTTVALPTGGEMTITGVPAQHGPAGVWQAVGPVIGFALSGKGLPTVYISGDNSSLEVVREIASTIGPVDVALLFVGGAKFDEVAGGAYLTLSNDNAVLAARIMQSATVIPVHADGWAHFSESAEQLREAFGVAGMPERIIVLEPGNSTDVGT